MLKIILNYLHSIKNRSLIVVLKIIIPTLIAFCSLISYADYEYQKIDENGNIIHLVIIDPSEYEASLVSAHNQVFGREKIGDIAKRENAEIAINAGFFEIGDNQDGRPTGTLVSDGLIYALRTTKHGCFVKNGNKYSVEIVAPSLEISIGGNDHKVSKFNRFASGTRFYYFNSNWGKSTLSSYNDRWEIAINENNEIIEIAEHGNIKIPSVGHVISFPKGVTVGQMDVGDTVNFHWEPSYFTEDNSFAVMGIPPLVMDGQVLEGLSNKHKHARTAIGVRNDGKLIIAIVEHAYKRNIADVSLFEVRKIMEKKNISVAKATLSDLKTVLQEDLTAKGVAVGLTTNELADFMHKQNCVSAINLDGGGSTSLFMNGKYINHSIGDADEAAGKSVVRPVSDAIIFKKK
jgi:exopolysaccharide biosynthesis protein